MKKLKVLHVCSWYPHEGDAFIGNFVQRHVQAVSEYTESYTLSAHPSISPKFDQQKEGEVLESRVYFKKKMPIISYTKALQYGFEQLTSKIAFDLVHVHVAYPAALFTNGLEIPTVLSEHFSGYHAVSQHKWTNISKRVARKALRKAIVVMPVSHHLGKAITQFEPKSNVLKVSNVVDTSVFKQNTSLRNTTATPYFLHVSTLEERSKNIMGILAGFRQLQNDSIAFHLKIGGDGDLKQLQKKIDAAGLKKENYTVFGAKKSEEVAELMQEANALVMNSHFENQPCTILEALCCGTPVISSAVGGIPEEIGEDAGILFDNALPINFANALRAFISKMGVYQSVEIADNAQSKYSKEVIGELLQQTYVSALK